MDPAQYLSQTPLLDYAHPAIQALIQQRSWRSLAETEKIGAAYYFVRDEIQFGYNIDDAIPASTVLSDGYGQCNTKGILLMALFRAMGIPCRMHGFTIDKRMQKGAMTGLVYRKAPDEIIHSWIEIHYQDSMLELEGFILDRPYLQKLQANYAEDGDTFYGYGVATDSFQNPPIDWNGTNTYIQKDAILQDYGVYDSPDAFFKDHPQTLSPIKQFLFRHYARHRMNGNVQKIRNIVS